MEALSVLGYRRFSGEERYEAAGTAWFTIGSAQNRAKQMLRIRVSPGPCESRCGHHRSTLRARIQSATR